jgi:hypothetical protein
MTTYLYYISVSLRLMFFNFYLWIFDLCVVFCRQLSFFVLWSLQTLKMNDKYFRRFRINVMTSVFLWWIFISSVSTFLPLVFKFLLIFHKESTMCIINMSSNCSSFCSIVCAWHVCVYCLHCDSGPWLYPNIPSE